MSGNDVSKKKISTNRKSERARDVEKIACVGINDDMKEG